MPATFISDIMDLQMTSGVAADPTEPRRLWFGGSFDPIHHGHLITARTVAESAGFDRVILVPNHYSPLKLSSDGRAPAVDRGLMCRAAVSGDPLFEVDDVELDRPPPSYTIDTAKILRDRFGVPLFWLIGSDSLSTLPKWHRWQDLLSVVRFVVMVRAGDIVDWKSLPAEVQKLQSTVVSAPLIQISSTDIRARVAAGRSVRNLVPEPVERYIRENGLYARK